MGRRVALAAFAFVLGFSTVFVLMGASASAVNRLIVDHIDIIAKVAGAVIVLFACISWACSGFPRSIERSGSIRPRVPRGRSAPTWSGWRSRSAGRRASARFWRRS